MMTTLDCLPSELLSESFSYLAQSNAHVDVQNVRLVCRKFCGASSRFLFDSLPFGFTSQSLDILEEAAQDPVFSKTIRTLKANVSYYDEALGQIAQARLDRALDVKDVDAPNEFLHPPRIKMANKNEETVLEAHNRYACLYQDQKKLISNGAYIGRLASIFRRLAALEEIWIEDSIIKPGPEWKTKLRWFNAKQHSGEDFGDYSLTTSCWQGSRRYDGMPISEPPVHLLFDILEALATSQVTPKRFIIRVSAPKDLCRFSTSDKRLAAAVVALSRTEQVEFWMDFGSLPSSLDCAALCSFTRVFFSSPCLSELKLRFLFDEPSVRWRRVMASDLSLLSVLPHPMPSTHLKRISLWNVPLRGADLRRLVARLGSDPDTVDTNFEYHYLTGSWVDIPHMTRALAKLDRDEDSE